MSGATLDLWAVRLGLVVAGLAGWFWTQRLIGQRPWPAGVIGDGVHQMTEPLNRYLHRHPRAADALLVTTSAIIDGLGLFILARSIFGPSVRPFLGLLILYALRQICQGLCALPPPAGMIWRRPPIPSLLVTYGTATDLFFSGHTAIAVFGSVELARMGGAILPALGVVIAIVEATVVLVLRAHYTMDVFTGIVTALWAVSAADLLAPSVDHALAALVGGAR
jgi:hypothetical protein